MFYNPQWKDEKLKILPVKTFGDDKFVTRKAGKNVFGLVNV